MQAMSASREKKQRQTLSGLDLSEKEKKALLEAKKRKQKTIGYTVLGVVAAVAVVALLVWDNGVVQRHLPAYTVGSHTYTIADVDYNFYSTYNSYYSSYGSYLFDSDKDLKDQDAYEDEDGNMLSWYDVLMNQAITSLTQATVLVDEANAAGYTLSEEGQAQVDDAIASIEEACQTYSITETYYIHQMYGPYMTKDRLVKNLEMYALASEFATQTQQDYYDSYTTDEVDSYYTENAADLDTYSYRVVYASGAVETTTDEDGNTVEATDEETEAAMEAAEAVASEAEAALTEGDEDALTALLEDEDNSLSDNGTLMNTGANLSTYYADFLQSDTVEEGDVTVVEGSTGYYIVQFLGREKDEYHPASYRDITITAEVDDDADAATDEQMEAAKTQAEDLMNIITSEDDFIEQVSLYSTSSTASSEGLNSSALKSSMYTSDKELSAWLFGEDRQAGDMIVLPTTDGTGYRLLYFTAYDDTSYLEQTIRNAISSSDYTDWYAEVSEDYTSNSRIGYGLVASNM
jgi:hypothetical protein